MNQQRNYVSIKSKELADTAEKLNNPHILCGRLIAAAEQLRQGCRSTNPGTNKNKDPLQNR